LCAALTPEAQEPEVSAVRCPVDVTQKSNAPTKRAWRYTSRWWAALSLKSDGIVRPSSAAPRRASPFEAR